jgi:hypothetical protein
MVDELVPVALFAYARPRHLLQTLECLRVNRVPIIYAFSDGPRTPDKIPAVKAVREILRSVDWCDLILYEREENLGLGKSILTGVTHVLERHDRVIVFEDDLVCVPGTYDYLAAALKHYENETKVMSVTGWTHPRITPMDLDAQPYFDGRAECWVWGTWARAWLGMLDHTAKDLILECLSKGVDVYNYGADLPAMAEVEIEKNIWAVRWIYWHISRNGLCLRPPYSLVEHIGFDNGWANPPLRSCPPIPQRWPDPVEHSECARLWRSACGYPLGGDKGVLRIKGVNIVKKLTHLIRRVVRSRDG